MGEELGGLAAAVRGGDRRALAQAITLSESTRVDHRQQATALLDELRADRGRARRMGISGVPGSGKSTLIEALGLHAIGEGHRVAVLAIDPSSTVSGGSVLGDKTRMAELGRDPSAFIRPSPASGTLGGVARRTREAIVLCEAAGYDLVVVETVGVGQSEVAVADVVDLFVLAASPAGGDDLQGIKRGIMELADVIAVNKADGDLADAAQRAAAELRHAVGLLRAKRPGWDVEVLTCSALTGQGIPELWQSITAAHDSMTPADVAVLRAAQDVAWMWSEVTDTLMDRLQAHTAVKHLVPRLEMEVAEGVTGAAVAAARLLDAFFEGHPTSEDDAP